MLTLLKLPPLPERPLEGSVILLAGACGGVGRVASLALARAGARLILLDRDLPRLEALYGELEREGSGASLLPLDLAGASKEHYLQVRSAISSQFGQLDGLLYAAVHFEGAEPIASQPPGRWFSTLNVNLNAPYLLCHTLFPLLKRAPARLLFLGDSALLEVPYLGAYGVSKWGLAYFTRLLALEWEAFGIGVNLLFPGPVAVPTRRKLFHGEELLPPESLSPLLVYLMSRACRERGMLFRHLKEGFALRAPLLDAPFP